MLKTIKYFLFGKKFYCKDCKHYIKLTRRCKEKKPIVREAIKEIKPFTINVSYVKCGGFKIK